MLYKEFIQNIIDTRGQWSEDVRTSERGCARHHIIPKCMGGAPKTINWDKHSNIIWLYPSEHFIAHKLLAIENPNIEGYVCAYKRMCYSINLKDYTATPEEYELAENLFRKSHSKHLKGKKQKSHTIHNKELYSKQKSKQCTGKGNPMYGKGYKVSGGNNGKATKLYFYDNLTFDYRLGLIDYLKTIDNKICVSTIRKFESGSTRVVREHPILNNLTWRYKDEDKVYNAS